MRRLECSLVVVCGSHEATPGLHPHKTSSQSQTPSQVRRTTGRTSPDVPAPPGPAASGPAPGSFDPLPGRSRKEDAEKGNRDPDPEPPVEDQGPLELGDRVAEPREEGDEAKRNLRKSDRLLHRHVREDVLEDRAVGGAGAEGTRVLRPDHTGKAVVRACTN